MASKSSHPEEDYSCPVCCDIFKDPVVLPCSHSFCNTCLHEWWREKIIKQCPVCKKISSMDPLRNLALKNVCEAFVQQRQQKASTGSEVRCSLHNGKLKLFCHECQQPVCLVCRDSKKHTNHSFRPIDEAALDHKEEVQKLLKPLQEKLKNFDQVKTNYDQTAAHIKFQIQHTEMQMKEQFKKLHHFLQKEEEARIKALSEEGQQKSHMMKEKIEGLNKEISSLSFSISTIEEDLRAGDISFLQNYKTTMEKVQLTLHDPQPISGALIDVVKHLKNLTLGVWEKMKDIVSYTPVIVDPNTAHPQLMLSSDLTIVRCGQRQELPDNPERFDSLPFVLGSEVFKSGTHSWDVEVGDSTNWSVGMLQESYQRKELILGGKKKMRSWGIELNNGTYTAVHPSGEREVLPVNRKPKVIRLKLDCGEEKEGKLSFSDCHRRRYPLVLHTFTGTFPDTLVPFFGTDHTAPLKILPGQISVSLNAIHKSTACPIQ